VIVPRDKFTFETIDEKRFLNVPLRLTHQFMDVNKTREIDSGLITPYET
jgi:hypothetical protein